MALGEFSLIKTFFAEQGPRRSDVALAIGDDCALLTPPPGQCVAVTTDTLVENVHFTADAGAAAIGHKAVAVNLSDLASMGAEPAWLSLALTLPEVDEAWLAEFAQGALQLAQQHNIQLIGGDTTRGPLTITLTAQGLVPAQQALRRDQGRPGDRLYVTGTLGDAAVALAPQWQTAANPEQRSALLQRLQWPTPKVATGLALRGLAYTAIDLSDGLAADLGHILERSQCGAQLWLEQLPVSTTLKALMSAEEAARYALQGGDDYELLFAVPEHNAARVEQHLQECSLPYYCIGRLIPSSAGELSLLWHGEPVSWSVAGFQHF